MKAWLQPTPMRSTFLCMLCLGVSAFAQNPANKPNDNSSWSTPDQMSDLIELDVFGGISTYGTVTQGLGEKMANGGVGGGGVTFNFSHYIGLELMFDYAQANVRFLTQTQPGLPTYSFGNHNYNVSLNPVFYFTPRGSRIQPYLTVGVGAEQFTPTSTAKNMARQPAIDTLYGSGNLNDNLQVVLNYGGGIKYHLSDHFGLRFDARGFFSRNPTFNLPNYPTGGIYIPSNSHLNGLQATVGLVFYLGQAKCPPMPPSPPPPAPLEQGTITGLEGQTICQGKPVPLHSTASGPAGHALSYAWTLNGQPSGADSPDFSFTPNNTGTFNIEVRVTDKTPPPPPLVKPKKFPERCWVQPAAPQAAAPVTATATTTVSENTPTISSATATPADLTCSTDQSGQHTAALMAQASGGACGGNLTYKWAVTEGSVANDASPNATFDASTLNFQGGPQEQTKAVTATLTVTSETGRTASKTVDINVKCPPQFVRMDDVIFAKNKARVNNCGKRVLIDEAATRLASGDYDIVLVGHRDTDEQSNAPVERVRGRRRPAAANPLDEQRVLNAGAVLSAGTSLCGTVDPSRIKVDWVGTTQTSEPRAALCGTSNLPATKERRGSQVTEADKNRRVEVYLVPHNSTTYPPAVQQIKALPDDQVKPLGCPR